jgi:hypothetical protein
VQSLRKGGCDENSCWKKYPHKPPSKSSTEDSGLLLDEELLVCNINVDYTYYVTENIENTYYCVRITEDGQLDDLASRIGIVESLMIQEDPLMANPYIEFCDASNKKRMMQA